MEFLFDYNYLINLTDREKEVLKLLAKFKCNKEIADELRISESTTKAHISSILKKFNVNDRSQCVIIGLKIGLIQPYEVEIKIRDNE